ncbi:MAG: hypothetical protein JSS71_06705 [Armatimonadetes bacterium]|nr:hypothetical protein [Armatimonadota bacterium]MBX3107678.1 hypothetical protein [Fimbriimonadaceae bacterium]
MNDTIFTALANNGPWALTSFFLLNQVIKAWTNDRDQITKLLTEFKDALSALTHAVEELGNR